MLGDLAFKTQSVSTQGIVALLSEPPNTAVTGKGCVRVCVRASRAINIFQLESFGGRGPSQVRTEGLVIVQLCFQSNVEGCECAHKCLVI